MPLALHPSNIFPISKDSLRGYYFSCSSTCFHCLPYFSYVPWAMILTRSLKWSKFPFRSSSFKKIKKSFWSFWGLWPEHRPKQSCSPLSQCSWGHWSTVVSQVSLQRRKLSIQGQGAMSCFTLLFQLRRRMSKLCGFHIFVFSKDCSEHNVVMFSNRWTRNSNHWC